MMIHWTEQGYETVLLNFGTVRITVKGVFSCWVFAKRSEHTEVKDWGHTTAQRPSTVGEKCGKYFSQTSMSGVRGFRSGLSGCPCDASCIHVSKFPSVHNQFFQLDLHWNTLMSMWQESDRSFELPSFRQLPRKAIKFVVHSCEFLRWPEYSQICVLKSQHCVVKQIMNLGFLYFKFVLSDKRWQVSLRVHLIPMKFELCVLFTLEQTLEE